MTPDTESEYFALTQGVGLVDLSGRTQIELTGADRTSFLHNMCTNDVRSLEPGCGCEAFLTNVQGKVLGHIFVYCCEESIVMETVPGQADTIINHLERYVIREKVQMHDRTKAWGQLFLSGVRSEEPLSKLCDHPSPVDRLNHVTADVAGVAVHQRRVDLAGPSGIAIQCLAEDSAELTRALVTQGAMPCQDAAFQSARIEAGTPLYGKDINSDNLPQEIARDTLAISFTKGCYLGQETVARIDALGHVNKLLVGVRSSNSDVPLPRAEIRRDDKIVGQITSAAMSFKLGAPLALAFIRRGHHKVGTRLESDYGGVEVISLPVEA